MKYSKNCRQSIFSPKKFLSSVLVSALALGYETAIADPSDIQFQLVPNSGIDYVGESWGAAWGDFNGDGYPDLFASNHRNRPALWVYNRNGTFSEISKQIDVSNKWFQLPHGDTHGATWADFDNDGDEDLTISAGGSGGTQFFVNVNNTLVFKSEDYDLDLSSSGGRMPVWFDYNNDGRLDMMMAFKANRARLMRQDSSRFRDVTSSYISCRDDYYGQLGDLRVDGRMELLCGAVANFPDRLYDYITQPFTNLTSMLPAITPVIDTVMADFNGDLRPDVFVLRGVPHISDAVPAGTNGVEATMSVGGSTYRAFSFQTTGIVTMDVDWDSQDQGVTDASAIRVGTTKWSPGSAHFTLDPSDPTVWGNPSYNSAVDRQMLIGYTPATKTWRVDLSAGNDWSTSSILVDSTAPVSKIKIIHQIANERAMPPSLLTNTLSGFVENTTAAGLGTPVSCTSAVAEDFDNDMDLDLFLTCRSGTANVADILYENQGDGTFVAVPNAGGAAGIVGLAVHDQAGTSDSVVAADYDADGFMDFVVTNGLNMRPLYNGGPYQLFHNTGKTAGNTNRWIEIDLQGTVSNRDAIGAIAYLTAGGVTQTRGQDGGYHRWSQNFKRLHFGLGPNDTVTTLQVKWPNGTTSSFSNVAANHIYRVSQNGTIEEVALDADTTALQCRQPTYDPALNSGLYVWKDCTNGTWRVQAVAAFGAAKISNVGNVSSDQPFTSVTPVSIEIPYDTLDYTTNPNNIQYIMNVANGGVDGFNFTYPASANVCFGVGATAGATAVVGHANTVVTLPFDLKTLQPCS